MAKINNVRKAMQELKEIDDLINTCIEALQSDSLPEIQLIDLQKELNNLAKRKEELLARIEKK